MSSFFRLFRYLKPHLGVLGLAIVFMAVSALFEGVSLGFIAPFLDRILSQRDVVLPAASPVWLGGLVTWVNTIDPWKLLLGLAVSLPFLFFGKALAKFLQQYFMNDASQRVITDLRYTLFKKCTTLPVGFFSRQSTGGLVSRVTFDVSIIQNSVTECTADLIYQSLRLIPFAATAFLINWKWATAIFIVVPLIAWPVQQLGKALKKLSSRSQVAAGDLNTTLYETYSGIPVVQAYGMEETVHTRFDQINQHFYRLQMKMIKRREVLAPLTEVICVTIAAPILWFGGSLVLQGELSLGIFLTFILSFFAMMHPLKRISRVNGVIQQAIAAAERLFEILDEPAAIKNADAATPLPHFTQAIRYEHVGFAYTPSTPVLQDITLDIAKGEVVAFVGSSGVGKTTIMNLLPRFYDPTAGRVTIDGHDLRDVTVESLRGQIALVTQDTVLFNDTVRNNIVWGKLDATDAEVEAASQAAHAHEFIIALPDGYHSVVGESGGTLSGGQRQRLALARAFLRDAPIVILDEATSQLDAESEHLINQAVNRLMEGRTVLLIAHRLSTVRHAQRIIVMHEGRIVEQGSHEDLLTQSALYRRVAALQFVDGSSELDSIQQQGVSHTA